MPAHAVLLNPELVARARAVSRSAGVLVALVGVLVLAGWTFDAAILKGLYAGITMKANAALGFVLAGASLWLLTGPRRDGTDRVGQICAGLAGVIGLATLSQHVVGWDLGIDQLLVTEDPGAAATTSPGRMGPPASACFALAGVALMALYRGGSTLVAQTAAILIGVAALLATTGYAYGTEQLYGIAKYTGIALHTAVTLLLLSFGLLACTVDRGVAAVIVGTGAGSVMARRLLLFAVPVPLLLGWLRLRLETAGYFDTRFGIATLVLAIIVVLSALIVHTAVRLNRAEQLQVAAEGELRDRLQEMETMMEVLPIGAFMATDRAASQIIGNRAAREFLRMPAPQSNLSLTAPSNEAPQHFRVFRNGVEVQPDDLPVQKAARTGIPVHDQEVEVVFADGTVKHGLLSALPLLDDDGGTRGAVASIMDITARRAAEQEREQLLRRAEVAREQAEAANRTKDQFLATISHELRTPLGAILGWSAMLREGMAVDEQTRETALATIERNAKAQAQLIDDLLDVSRIVSGKLRVDVKPLDLAAVVTGAVDVVRPAADAKGITIQCLIEPDGCSARGDATRLQQVVWNLLMNAVKFSPRGGSVCVQLTVPDAEAIITVSDSGEGIDAAFLPYVFDRFTQADPRKTRFHGGLGLGLSIARHLTEMHGGTIHAFSAGLGKGATFTVRLPLHTAGLYAAAPQWQSPRAGEELSAS